jgi:hypothetical protein
VKAVVTMFMCPRTGSTRPVPQRAPMPIGTKTTTARRQDRSPNRITSSTSTAAVPTVQTTARCRPMNSSYTMAGLPPRPTVGARRPSAAQALRTSSAFWRTPR